MCLVNLDFKFDDLLACIMFFFTNLSSIEATEGNSFSATFLDFESFNFLIAFLVDLC